MYYNIIWIGKYQESMKGFNISGSISKYGFERPNHFVFNPSLYNSYEDYVVEKIILFQKEFNELQFYFYDQYFAYEIDKKVHIKKNLICANSESILFWLNNKSIAREWVRNIIKTPESAVLSNEQIKLDFLQNIFWGYKRFIAQKMISSGGHKTFLIDKFHTPVLENDLYLVSPYYEISLSVNVTSVIFQDTEITFPVSLQIIKEENGNLLYNGSDFISVNLIPKKTLLELMDANHKIIKRLSFLGYRGICGIDFLLHNDKVYFLEMNPRFQGSSFLIDMSLEQYALSLYQLNIDAFDNHLKDDVKDILISMDIPYCFRKDMANRIVTKTGIVKFYPDNLSTEYYDYFADKYHIMLKDWNKKIDTQGKILKRIFDKYSKRKIDTILDCTCGIGIQALSLALEGFTVVGSDLSENELDFAREEAQRRDLNIFFTQADCRYLEKSISQTFDAVISIDSALPHLLTRDNFVLAFQSIYNRMNRGGVFLSSYRDYESLLKTKPNMAYPVRFNSENGIEYTILRRWKWEGEYILSKQYVIADSPSESKLYTNSYKQWAVTSKELYDIVKETKFSECYWLLPEDSGFTQPMLCLVK